MFLFGGCATATHVGYSALFVFSILNYTLESSGKFNRTINRAKHTHVHGISFKVEFTK